MNKQHRALWIAFALVLVVLAVLALRTRPSQLIRPEVDTASFLIVTYDHCQYLVSQWGQPGEEGYSYAITHKGDCTNSVHSR